MKLGALLFFLGAMHFGAGAKILTLAPIPSKSHHLILERIAVELAKKDHDVTIVTPFKQSKPIPKLKEIIIPDLYKEMMNLMTKTDEDSNQNSTFLQVRKMSKWIWLFIGHVTGPNFSDMMLSIPEIQKLIKSNEKYDLIIAETFFVESAIAGFSYKFKAPIIGIAGFMPNYFANHLVGNPAPASYIPDSLLGLSNKMNFFERLENFIYTVGLEMNYRFLYARKQDAVMKKHFGDDLPPFDDILKNTSLVLVNHHFSLAFPRPYLPNMVEVGSYHIYPPKPLPADLQKFFDESKEGVVLFSMGSHIKSAELPQEKKEAILKALSKLKQDVIWKFEDETLKNVPKNVKILKWIPQSDILAHPNLKVFVTHGGLLSTTEAVLRGVPVVGIPVAGDQPTNMKYTTAAGFGVTLDFDELNEHSLYEAITEVLNNPKYQENAKRGSALIKDRPLPAMDTALFWIEYVLRHKGAPHLRSAAQDLAWYQLYLLDVLAAVLITIYLFFLITKFIIKSIFNFLCRKNVKVPKKKKES